MYWCACAPKRTHTPARVCGLCVYLLCTFKKDLLNAYCGQTVGYAPRNTQREREQDMFSAHKEFSLIGEGKYVHAPV